jgi:hypothetical protein
MPTMTKPTVQELLKFLRNSAKDWFGTFEGILTLSSLTLSQDSRSDSFSKRSVPRSDEDIDCRVYVAVMNRTALDTLPSSYSEVCDTFWAAGRTAARADSGTTGLVHFLKRGPVRKPEFFATAGRQLIQVECRRPFLTPPKRVLLPIVEEIPNEVNRPCLSIQPLLVVLYAVAIGQDHIGILP